MTVYFLIPIYNEAENLEQLFKELTTCLPGINKKYVFSDDGSKDESCATIHKLFSLEKYIILGNGTNNGPGFAFNLGFEWINEDSTSTEDKIVTLEADNTSDLSILPTMLALSNLNFDLVLASVYSQGGGFDKTSFLRKILSAIANILLRLLLNIKVQTLSSFYRVYHVTLLKSIKAREGVIISENGFLCMIELLLKAIQAKAQIIEVPMILNSTKRKGKSKMKILRTMYQYFIFISFHVIKGTK